MKYWKLLTTTTTLVLSTSVNAALISYDGYGHDTVGNLDWININLTENYSYNDILSETSLGGALDGWRYATTSEYRDLVHQMPSYGEYSNLHNLADFLGKSIPVYPTDHASVNVIHSGDAGDPSRSNIVYFSYYFQRSRWIAYDFDVDLNNINVDSTTLGDGHILVRDHVSAVPIPATVWLFGSGFIGLIGFARQNII